MVVLDAPLMIATAALVGALVGEHFLVTVLDRPQHLGDDVPRRDLGRVDAVGHGTSGREMTRGDREQRPMCSASHPRVRARYMQRDRREHDGEAQRERGEVIGQVRIEARGPRPLLVVGLAALFGPGSGDLYLAAGFGGLQLAFGAAIARRYGG